MALLWCLAKAQQQDSGSFDITLVHDVMVYDNGQPQPGIPSLGGHSRTVPVTVNGNEYWIDLGVQMIAPVMYPNLMSMLKLPQFASVKMDPVPLKVACAFPGASPGGPAQYWGNFPDYQTTSLYQQGASDAATFEALLKAQPGMMLSLQAMLDAEGSLFKDLSTFETYFLDPYLSIMNGYGSALLGEIYVPEVAFLFDQGYASFTNWSSDFMRFHYGAMQWVQAMATDAMSSMPNGAVTILTGATVIEVYPGENGPSVIWEIDGQSQAPEQFDVVVLTTDMGTNGTLLDNSNNPLWSFYEQYVGQDVWGLIPGFCYLHQDASILAPGMPSPPEETLQFTVVLGDPGATVRSDDFVDHVLLQEPHGRHGSRLRLLPDHVRLRPDDRAQHADPEEPDSAHANELDPRHVAPVIHVGAEATDAQRSECQPLLHAVAQPAKDGDLLRREQSHDGLGGRRTRIGHGAGTLRVQCRLDRRRARFARLRHSGRDGADLLSGHVQPDVPRVEFQPVQPGPVCARRPHFMR